ncbi:TolC family protein [Zavarzinia compransoris]|uniref:TolC family protein n=1 Tax=Zavarzinia compransoris TaxID=1264899 RepID=A0A317EBE4_9PROT|nr:TolC family protein [Zavarzinia compransoris]PWR23902.1 hypothetical protein DKG75_04955 [Zavarzinia compransoris]TDP48146.1 adhesin transport system outer membrane protein [Zavarzinia compransoris]
MMFIFSRRPSPVLVGPALVAGLILLTACDDLEMPPEAAVVQPAVLPAASAPVHVEIAAPAPAPVPPVSAPLADDLGLVERIEARERFAVGPRLPAEAFVTLVRDAVISHPQYNSAATEAEIGGFAIDEAWAGLMPQVSVGATGSASQFSATRSDMSGTSRSRGFEKDADVFVRARQLLFDAGATFDRIGQGEAEYAAGLRQQEATATGLAVEAIASYYETLAFTMLVGLGEDHLGRLRELEEMVDARRLGGGGDLGDLAEVRAERANAETRHVSIRRRLTDARSRFGELFGREPGAELPWPAIAPGLPPTREDALAMAAATHPALLAAREKVRASGLALSAVEAERYPNLSLEVDGARYDIATDPVDGVTFRIVGSMKLYDGGLSDAREGRAGAAQRKARFDEAYALRSVERRTAAAFDALRLMEDESRAADAALAATAAARVATRERFLAVGGNLLNVLNAEVDAHNAAVAWIEVMVNREIARFRLLEATGGLAPYMGLEVSP